MTDIVDCCRVWESHCEVEIQPRISADRHPARAICQVTAVEPAPATSTEMETVEDIIRKAGATTSTGGPDTVGPGKGPHPATDGSDMPTNAGGTGAIGRG